MICSNVLFTLTGKAVLGGDNKNGIVVNASSDFLLKYCPFCLNVLQNSIVSIC